MIVAIHVDDTVIACKAQHDLTWFMKEISKAFKFKNVGALKCVLGLHVGRSNGSYWINQEKCMLRLAEKCGVHAGKRSKTPIATHPNLDDYECSSKVDTTSHRAIVGAILHVSVASRPDITCAINKLARCSQDPRQMHMDAAKRLIKCLVNAAGHRIAYERKEDAPLVQACTDASHGSDKKTGKSTSGFFVEVCGGPVSWGSMRQTVVADSSAHAECMAPSTVCKDITSVAQMAKEIAPTLKTGAVPVIGAAPVHVDSASAISTANKPGFSKPSKSIRLAFHNSRDLTKKGETETKKIDGK